MKLFFSSVQHRERYVYCVNNTYSIIIHDTVVLYCSKLASSPCKDNTLRMSTLFLERLIHIL